MSKRKMENLFFSKSNSSGKESFYEAYTNPISSDEEEIRFPRNKNINRITSSDSDSDIDKCNRSDTECNEDTVDEILQELVIEEERRTDDTEKSTIQFGERNEFSSRQKSFSFPRTDGLIRQLPGDVNSYDAFELFVDDEIINLYQKITTRKDINIRIFRELLAAKLLELSENTKTPYLRWSQHNIAVRKNDSGRSIRRACKLCYANKRRRMDRTKTRENLKKTTIHCPNYPDQPQLCIQCFKVLRSK